MEIQIILPLAIALLAAVFISLPFFRAPGGARGGDFDEERPPDPGEERLGELASRKDSLLSAIKDMEFDYGLGKLSREDYEELTLRYKAEAALVMREIDEILADDGKVPGGRDIEGGIAAHGKRPLTEYDEEELEMEILSAREHKWSAGSGPVCGACGNPCGPEDLFCPKCGARLNGDNDKKANTV